ncbi:hypothetical protein Ddye_015100 [Dipteronia dyeriana]|uniref:Uncharacterized protein n=1 Tax=Dipteronia dyeriana TaxID=168575 RepID=A0AAD9WY65_9ROSI|nr:hypothetical protein Ddye_015100 [Dipteronia dyeriana]
MRDMLPTWCNNEVCTLLVILTNIFGSDTLEKLIVDKGALLHLANLLKTHKDGNGSRAVNSVIRRAADAIANLAHQNSIIKTCGRMEGGIPPVVELLEFTNTKIVECNALPTLIPMLPYIMKR